MGASSNIEGASDELVEGLQATIRASNQMEFLHGASCNTEGAWDELDEDLQATIGASNEMKLLHGGLVTYRKGI